MARRKNEGTPLIITASEWGQFSYSQADDRMGTLFFSRVLNLGNPGITTVGTVLDHEFDAHANPTIALPGNDGKGRQIAGREISPPGLASPPSHLMACHP